MQKRNRKLAAALGFVAATGACGAFGTFATFENVALFGEETSATAVKRELVVEPKDGTLASPSGRKAFLVGADDYADALDLVCVKNDVEAFAARLVEIGFDEKDVTVLKTGGDFSLFPTKANIESRFRTFLKTLRPGDFVVVYLSGHGLRSAASGESFFAPIDVKPLDPFKTSVSIDKILAALARSKANFRWAIVDACRNDPTGSTSGSPSAIFKTRSSGAAKALTEITDAPSSVALLQSCQPGRVSFEGDDDLKNGLFTLGLLEALDPNGTKADVDQNGALTFTEVLKYVSERTNELASDRYGESQIPCWSGSFTDFAILTDLRRDGVSREDWERAEALYREAAALRRERRYREAAEKLDLATAINKDNEEYAAARAEIAELLAAQTALREARQAAETAAREASAAETAAREAVDEANAAEKAEAERKAREAADAKRRAEEAARRAVAATNGERGADVAWDANPEAGTRKTLEIDGVEYAFRYCPPGEFLMGSPVGERERNSWEHQRRVTLTQGFWMLETEVTQAMWKSVKGSNPPIPQWAWDLESGVDTANFPAVEADWRDCQDFLINLTAMAKSPERKKTGRRKRTSKSLNAAEKAPDGWEFRLPTEAEWEYACRAGTTTPYFWGETWNNDYANCDDGRPSGVWGRIGALERPAPVGSYAANAWGLRDMSGNVEEWCSDSYGIYDAEKLTNPTEPRADLGLGKVCRGGSWKDFVYQCRSAYREFSNEWEATYWRGFRFILARESKE